MSESGTALPLSKVIELGRRSLDLVGDGDWTPQDAALSMLIVAAERESNETALKRNAREEAIDLLRCALRELDFAVECLVSREGKNVRLDTASERIEMARAAVVTAVQMIEGEG